MNGILSATYLEYLSPLPPDPGHPSPPSTPIYMLPPSIPHYSMPAVRERATGPEVARHACKMVQTNTQDSPCPCFQRPNIRSNKKGFKPQSQSQSFGGKKKKKTAGTATRPFAIREWDRFRRAASFDPKISNASAFGEQLVVWWRDVNPVWRRTPDGSLNKAEGDYSELDVPGPNGFLMVLIGLKWWADRGGSTGREWTALVEEVDWCIAQLGESPTTGMHGSATADAFAG
uniref:Uncharacterized protein n=1 Tax=Mycena chlorophos TaxID=658473 RepID=A0ABQ0MDG4_MYCCL|nr:predicted protein [Mycena chlorophos]